MKTNWDNLLNREELSGIYREKRNRFSTKTVKKFEVDSYINEGYEILKENKNSTTIGKIKSHDELFENRVWCLLYRMGFKKLNKDRNFSIYFNNEKDNKQIDICALDDEVCLLIECKSSSSSGKTRSWKTELESMKHNKGFLISAIKNQFFDRKIAYVFCVDGYTVGDRDKSRLQDGNNTIPFLDEDKIKYYENLVEHIGEAARYQFLGTIFENTKISNLDYKVPAIKGSMGGLNYYVFSIEPATLLKMSYVLHRSNANTDAFPTYQRFIKKDRLREIQTFVNNGGFFPNSLIVSIDAGKDGLKFDQVAKTDKDSSSKLGVLSLPSKYHSIYIIDGQHRLYGYAGSKYSNNNTIPVVAFENLPNRKQLELFFEINENQKSVSKTLRNILNRDLYIDSGYKSEQNNAAIIDVAINLGDSKNSPLVGRIQVNEDEKSSKRCITLDVLKSALENSELFPLYKKNSDKLEKHGIFGDDNFEFLRKAVLEYLENGLRLIRDNCMDEWLKDDKGYITINNTMYAIIRILSDILVKAANENQINIISNSTTAINITSKYIEEFAKVIKELDFSEIKKIKEAKGSGAKKISYRSLQLCFHEHFSWFTNSDFQRYYENEVVDYTTDVTALYRHVEKYIFTNLKNVINLLGTDWDKKILPMELGDQLVGRQAVSKRKGEAVELIDCIYFSEIKNIVNFSDNWSKYIKQQFNKNDANLTKTNFLAILSQLETIKNKIDHGDKLILSDKNLIDKVLDNLCIDL